MKISTRTDNELPADILRTVAYFDLFDYPVTSDQIYSFLPRNSVTRDDVALAADQLVRDEKLQTDRGYYLLSSSDQKISAQRQEGERAAGRMLSYARTITRLLKIVPFVRGVFLTGSLSKSVAAQDSDIDFMIVTAPERLWIVRTMLTFFRKTFLLGKKKYFCTNYYVTENGYSLNRKNLYAAVEVVTTKAVWNTDAYMRYRQTNAWTKEFLPNMSVAPDSELLVPSRHSVLQRALEFVLQLLPLRSIDRRLMEYHRTYWNATYANVSEERRASMFIISPDVSASWPEDRQVPVLTRYKETLSRLGLRS
jgi:hypothetical protein